MDAGHHGFRHRKHQPEQAVLRQTHDRHGLRLGRRALLDHRPRVGVAFGDDAGKGRGDAGIGVEGFDFVLVGARHLHLLFGRCQRGLGRRHLRFGHKIARLGIVDFLLRHQVGARLAHRGQARIRQMRRFMRRLRPPQLIPRMQHVGIAAPLAGRRPGEIVHHLWNLQDG